VFSSDDVKKPLEEVRLKSTGDDEGEGAATNIDVEPRPKDGFASSVEEGLDEGVDGFGDEGRK
jgi:hypothetical protein